MAKTPRTPATNDQQKPDDAAAHDRAATKHAAQDTPPEKPIGAPGAGDAGTASAASLPPAKIVDEIDLSLVRVRVTAPAGPRRRAGCSFDTVPRIVNLCDLGETAQEQRAALDRLMADPALSVAPVVDETETP
ncbi:MAG: hypothetical protein M9905_17525 [Rhizobiaceae bacterium]|nr:hypothetical protein [Rhizobiaceae bacterium]